MKPLPVILKSEEGCSMSFVRRLLDYGVVTWLMVVLLWQLLAIGSNPEFLPGPLQTLRGVIELSQDGSLFQYIGISLSRVLTGWVLGSVIAVPVGLLMGRISILRVLTEPFLHFIRFIPPLAFITLFLLWFGIGEMSKVVLIMYATLFTVILNTMTGVLSVEEDKLRSARSMGASERQIMQYVVIPATIPYIFTGIRLAMSSSFMAIIGAEMVASNAGVGFMIWTSRLYFKTDWIFVGLFCLGIMGFFTDRLLIWIGSATLSRYGITRAAFGGKLK
jgi:NitT/TauT family transport system permease protein